MCKERYLKMAEDLINLGAELNNKFRAFVEESDESGDDRNETKWLEYAFDDILSNVRRASTEASKIFVAKGMREELKK